MIDVTGKRYGRLIAHWPAGKYGPTGEIFWLCSCKCGSLSVVLSRDLRKGHTSSCGCFAREETSRVATIHGHAATRTHLASSTYNSWTRMMQRCTNPQNNRWYLYGGRGITVCKRWLKFENFLADMGERPLGKSIDRINTDGNYEPANCKWSTPKEQANNRRRSDSVIPKSNQS